MPASSQDFCISTSFATSGVSTKAFSPSCQSAPCWASIRLATHWVLVSTVPIQASGTAAFSFLPASSQSFQVLISL